MLAVKSSVASPERLITRISRICTTKPQTLSITPIETAPPESMPLRPKKRMSSATRAAELGRASATNWTAYSSMSTGRNRTGLIEAPIVPKVCAT